MTPDSLKKTVRWDQVVALATLALVGLGCFLVVKPFFSALLWAIILTFSSWPAYRRLLQMLGGRATLAALVMTLGITLVLLVPSLVIVLSFAGDVREFAEATATWFQNGPSELQRHVARIPWVGNEIVSLWNTYAADREKLFAGLQGMIDPVSKWLLAAGATLGRGVIELALSMFLAFFFFRDGEKLGQQALAVAQRLGGDEGDHLLRVVAGGTIRGVVYGILGTAMVQGLVAVIGFSIAGVPAAVLLGLLTFLLSPLPVGPPLIWIPACLWVFQSGSPGMAIFLFLWGLLVVSSIDNLIRPLIISQGNHMPFVLIFMGVVGGGFTFGLIGIFLGPTLLAVSYRLTEEWLAMRKRPLVVTPDEPDPDDLPPPSPEFP